MKRPRIFSPPPVAGKHVTPIQKHIDRLRHIEGATFESSRGVKGIIFKEGVYCPSSKQFTPYYGEDKNGNPFMRMEDLEDIRRDNEAHITFANDTFPTEEGAINLVEGYLAAGQVFKAMFAARRLFPRQFKKRYPGPLPGYTPRSIDEAILLNEKPPTEEVEGFPEPEYDAEDPPF